jgi:penicillin-insensitive murein endopeptidase
VELPERGEGFERYRSQGTYYWGQPALVRGIEEAARSVHQALPGGAPLLVGDLSARHGGKISRHQSHRSGRDVDFLWYVTTLDGVPIKNPKFAQLGPDGLAKVRGPGGYVQLDVPRQWLFIKSLLSSPHMDVQLLYSSSVVEALVINYALAKGDDPELIWRAQNVMLEPADSLPHDDHLHLRVACSPEASVQGCAGGGPYWNWLPTLPGVGPLPDNDIELLGEGRI